MQLSIPYRDHQKLNIEIPDSNLLGILEPNEVPSVGEREALSSAIGGLAEFLKGIESVLVIINDATRPTPTTAMLDVILPIIEASGLQDEQMTILVATGAHRPAKAEELGQLLGSYEQRLSCRLISHVATDEDSLTKLGMTRNGTPILLNKLLFAHDRIIVTGSVEPHYFAGYTGGRKAFLPGIAGFATIEANHKLAISDQACSLNLVGNPVHEDMMDALTHIKAPVFSVMTVLDKGQKVVATTSGDIVTSFEQAVDIAKEVFCVPIEDQADIVLSIAKFPMDINLYQSQKAIDNGALAVRDGGTLILVSSCREGIGDQEFATLLGSCNSPNQALEKIKEGYKLGYHKAAKMAAVSRRINVKAYTDLEDDQLKSLFIEPVHDLQKALEVAIEGLEEPTVLVLADGCVTVPSL